ncbi:LTA synthase family protein [Clostridium tertium]|uniref:LTA synthase family protein n=1 Tax=Clostridium tertium TaxID=1559 RepID=UPI0024B36339|nr:LTA synthase family protein [Clostridium tertium]MDI9217806.1 LTA synthase family protein [Clostridium tertium]
MDISKIKNRIFEYIRGHNIKLSFSKISKFRFATIIDMLIKSLLFMALIEVSSADVIKINNISFKFIFVYLAFILLFYSCGYLFKGNKQLIYYIFINISYSFLLIMDLWYFRVNRDFLGLKNMFYIGTFNPVGESLYQFRAIDLLFIVDIVFIIIYAIIKKTIGNDSRRVRKFLLTNSYAIITLVISFFLIDILSLGGWENRILTKRWSTLMSARASGPIGYHLIESYRTLSKVLNPLSIDEKTEIENWISDNKEELQPNEYKGSEKGKNVIFIQVESLENFVINKSVNGKEISPFLNKLSREGLYFSNIYEQNNAGNSIDCDFMVNTSIYPLGDKITALNYGEDTYSNSLPRILEGEGYNTISSHAEEIGEFNWTEIHKNSFGVKNLWDIGDYIYEETVGYGLSDRSFLTQVSNKLENVDRPFFFQSPTLSNHGPFNIDKKYRQLDLPKEIDESYLGGYFESVLYTDKQIENFFNELDKKGILDNTMVVIYGDHAGVHKYYNDDIKDLDYDGNWWKEYDNRIPLIMYSKDMKPNVIKASGGQVDIPTTVLYLLGVDDSKYINSSMGRILLNTNRDATIIKGNEIKGNVKSNEEKEHLLKSYEIGEKIIKNNYFGR